MLLRHRALFCCLYLLCLPATALGARVLLVGGGPERPLHAGPVLARLGERVRICALIRRGRRYYADIGPRRVRLGRRWLRRIRPLDALASDRGPVSFTWHRVEPYPHHVQTEPPNPGNPAYSNAVLFGARHGQWLGYDRIEYHETVIHGATNGCITVQRTHPTHPRVDVNKGLGTMRYKVVVQIGDEALASPGMESLLRGGISPRVLRVTFRSHDGLTGYLRGFFNVPNVFGSAGAGRTHQTELYQGADCADVIIGAAREMGARIPYTSARGLRRYAKPVTDKLLMTKEGLFATNGAERGRRVHLRFGEQVRPGDIMLINYVGFAGTPRSWDHVAVIDRDTGKAKGELDPRDPVLHMGYLYGLTEEAAASQAPAVIQLLRLRRSALRARPK